MPANQSPEIYPDVTLICAVLAVVALHDDVPWAAEIRCHVISWLLTRFFLC